MKTTLKKLIEKCWQIIEGVKKTHNKITGKKYWKPVVKLAPINENDVETSIYGCMLGEAIIVGDIISPVGESWETNE
jgi:hypothetical protein